MSNVAINIINKMTPDERKQLSRLFLNVIEREREAAVKQVDEYLGLKVKKPAIDNIQSGIDNRLAGTAALPTAMAEMASYRDPRFQGCQR